LIGSDFDDNYPEKTIYIRKRATLQECPDLIGHRVSFFLVMDPALKEAIRIAKVRPPNHWDTKRMCFYPADINPHSESLKQLSSHVAIQILMPSGAHILAYVGFDGRDNSPWCELQHLEQNNTFRLSESWRNYIFMGLPRRRVVEITYRSVLVGGGGFKIRASIPTETPEPNTLGMKLVLEKLSLDQEA
jgi:hypothetical protein